MNFWKSWLSLNWIMRKLRNVRKKRRRQSRRRMRRWNMVMIAKKTMTQKKKMAAIINLNNNNVRSIHRTRTFAITITATTTFRPDITTASPLLMHHLPVGCLSRNREGEAVLLVIVVVVEVAVVSVVVVVAVIASVVIVVVVVAVVAATAAVIPSETMFRTTTLPLPLSLPLLVSPSLLPSLNLT